jgi:hypothetical protein
MGQVVVEGDVNLDVFGRHVNRAARVEALADGGQVLVTLPVYDSARGWLTHRSVTWNDHGEYWLKGIDEPTRIHEVRGPGSGRARRPRGRRVRPRAWLAFSTALLAISAFVVWVVMAASPPPRPEPAEEPQLDPRDTVDWEKLLIEDATARVRSEAEEILQDTHPRAKYQDVQYRTTTKRPDGGYIVTLCIHPGRARHGLLV